MKVLLNTITALIFLLVLNFSTFAQNKKFDGNWSFEETRNGHYSSLSVNINQVGNQLEGDYGNVSSKESNGKILRAKITGNTAMIEIDCDWGGRGTVKITRLNGNRLHWQVIKRDESKGAFIVLTEQILKKSSMNQVANKR